MVMRVQHVEGEYRIVIPAEAMESLQLRDGMPVSIVPLVAPETSRYVSFDEGMKAYFETEPLHRNSYRELAK
jgi:hypothetical protein